MATLSLPALLTGVGLVAVSVVTGAAFLGAKSEPTVASDLRRYGVAATLAYLAVVVGLLGTVVLTDAGGAADTIRSVPAAAVVLLSVVAGLGGSALAGRGEYRACWRVRWRFQRCCVLVALLLYPMATRRPG